MSESWDKLIAEIFSCKKCPLHATRRNPVPGEGNPNAEVMFIGEAPGEKEDEQGKPFVGPAGKLLNKLLERAGLRRENVYITNVVKCRPPGNREPKKEEIEACSPYLLRQISLVRPRIIVTLGRVSASFIFSKAGLKFSSILQERGKLRELEIEGVKFILLPTLHPAAALYNPRMRKYLEEDFDLLGKLIRGEAKPKKIARLEEFFST